MLRSFERPHSGVAEFQDDLLVELAERRGVLALDMDSPRDVSVGIHEGKDPERLESSINEGLGVRLGVRARPENDHRLSARHSDDLAIARVSIEVTAGFSTNFIHASPSPGAMPNDLACFVIDPAEEASPIAKPVQRPL
jgi:hypothetical protein